MPANETPLGFVSYPDKQTPQWYTDDGDTMGLESWLAQMELLGLPTYATFTDLPDASTTPSHGDAQQQFAAVAADRTVYRSDGTEWVPFMGQGTADRPLQEQHVESLHAESLSSGEGTGEPSTFGGEVRFEQGTDHKGTDAVGIDELEAENPTIGGVSIGSGDASLAVGGSGALATDATRIGSGAEALGNSTTSVGTNAGRANTERRNAFFGVSAGRNTGETDETLGAGHRALNTDAEGWQSVGLGAFAGQGADGLMQNTWVGDSAGQDSDGHRQTGVGKSVLNGAVGSWIAALGWGSGQNSNADDCIYIGVRDAGYGNTEDGVMIIGGDQVDVWKGWLENKANENRGDLEALDDGAGIILNSPDGTERKRVRIDNDGNLEAVDV